MSPPYLLEVAVSVALVASAVGFAVGLAIGRGRQPRWQEKGSFVHKVSIGFATLDRLDLEAQQDRSVLRAGDQVLVVAALHQVSEVEERLRSVSRYGRLASWSEGLDERAGSVRAFGVRRRTA